MVAAEDTRVSRRLLTHYEIHGPRLVSYREDNQAEMTPRLMEWLQAGQKVALVTDAGMPGISDPGAQLVAACRAAQVPVEVVPGPTSVATALAASGFAGNRFVFEGFLPRRGSHRQARLEGLRDDDRPVVFFEAPHRIVETLEDVARVLGDRRVCLTRELTKKFEEVVVDRVSALLVRLAEVPPRGEYTVVVEGAGEVPATRATEEDVDAFLRDCKSRGLRARDASEAAAVHLGVSRKVAYQRYLDL